MKDVDKPWQIEAVHACSYMNNMQATANEGSQRLMSTVRYVQAGDGGSQRLITSK